MNKPMTPKIHALSDYSLVAALFIVPQILGLKTETKKLYCMLGSALLPYVALTDQPGNLKPLIPFKTHGKVDVMNVAGISLLALNKSIRKDKKALAFHLAFLGIGALSILLTDWEAR